MLWETCFFFMLLDLYDSKAHKAVESVLCSQADLLAQAGSV